MGRDNSNTVGNDERQAGEEDIGRKEEVGTSFGSGEEEKEKENFLCFAVTTAALPRSFMCDNIDWKTLRGGEEEGKNERCCGCQEDLLNTSEVFQWARESAARWISHIEPAKNTNSNTRPKRSVLSKGAMCQMLKGSFAFVRW
jgi:hypothetical protein